MRSCSILTFKFCLLAITYLRMRRKAQLPKLCGACVKLALVMGTTYAGKEEWPIRYHNLHEQIAEMPKLMSLV